MTTDHLTPADWARIARHVAGDESPTDAGATAAWIHLDPAREAAAAAARRVWARTGDLAAAAQAQHDVRVAQTDAGWRRMRERLASAGPPAADPSARARMPVLTHRRWWRAVGATAAVAAAALVAVVGLGLPGSGHRTYAAPIGERVTVFLPDGTRADLHPGTRMEVAFASPVAAVRRRLGLAADLSRRVVLVGEAVFTVRHDPARPFRVEAGGMVAEDIGTVFAVRAYPGDPRVRVAVAEGEVAVRSTAALPAAPPVRLGTGQVAEVARSGEVSVRSGEDAGAWFGWTRDRLVFRRARVGDVAAALSRWFGRPVLVPDAALADQRVTLDQPITSLEAAASAVATALGATFAASGDTIRIARP